ncbi:MAG: SDR family NAD(P)-dependent oxidoreductase [Rhodospirillales bacterium]|nr:SDR family NAD(P)-dependent oxidoreductase [Rhodospirillales bacterium]
MSRPAPPRLLIAGLGYSARAVARAALAAGWAVTAGRRESTAPLPGIQFRPFADLAGAMAEVSHLLVSVPPGEAGDPALDIAAAAIGRAAAAGTLRWIGYLSTTGVYGDRAGAWVDEASAPAPGNARSRHRHAAEQAWAQFAPLCAVDLFRLAGIYGPGRSAFDDLRAGRARRVLRPGHVFGRIHRDDIARAVLAAMGQHRPPGLRVLNLADDAPAETAEVVAHAAALLGLPAPPAVPYQEAEAAMSPMARSFWAECRRVSSARTKAALDLAWRYPSYREGLADILEEEGRGPSGAS